ncbi:hypothetical protein [Novosphingobium sp.]|uniref:hypothetical protein n=1 Tax=Novosphingobium sp. TaxID=1874826 RepID=UPI0025DA342A|nr:hypothetical protein [Novosphingobium sp.]
MKQPITTILAALVLTGTLAGCASASARPDAPHPQIAALGSTIVVGTMRITPISVIEDSRCPARVQCIWAGRVVVRVTMSSLTAKLTREMTMGEPVSIGGKDVVLVAVTPAKSGTPTKPAAYRFKFVVQPGAIHI